MNIPVLSLIVTFLHEFGHAAAAMMTGGHVTALQINMDGSGLCSSYGGSAAIITAGGYLGSIFFGNVMFYFGIRHKGLSKIIAVVLSVAMVFSSLIWFSTPTSFVITFVMGSVLVLLFLKIPWAGRVFLIISGGYSILYIIQDYAIGPSSDLESFSRIMGLTPLIWMYVWLFGAVIITAISIFLIVRRHK